MGKKIKIMMMPDPFTLSDKHVSGIGTVVRSYERVFPEYDMELLHPDSGDHYDLLITHAGMSHHVADIAMMHGIYFTGEYKAGKNEWRANHHVVRAITNARYVTVPSPWVAETFRRDFKIRPIIIPHGIFADEWEHDFEPNEDVVLWVKNRNYDVCDPTPLNEVAARMPDLRFVTTFKSPGAPHNVIEVGIIPPYKIKEALATSAVVISTVKETWGIVYAEAMACGTPVVTVNQGHVPNLVRHGVGGYCYQPENIKDAIYGIRWTIKHRDKLSRNARLLASRLSWHEPAARIRKLCEIALEGKRWL